MIQQQAMLIATLQKNRVLNLNLIQNLKRKAKDMTG